MQINKGYLTGELSYKVIQWSMGCATIKRGNNCYYDSHFYLQLDYEVNLDMFKNVVDDSPFFKTKLLRRKTKSVKEGSSNGHTQVISLTVTTASLELSACLFSTL